jgi:hypothetical protein
MKMSKSQITGALVVLAIALAFVLVRLYAV